MTSSMNSSIKEAYFPFLFPKKGAILNKLAHPDFTFTENSVSPQPQSLFPPVPKLSEIQSVP